ncbi:hypothetical protein LCGC14_0599020 [marine sediment metagenome]|uniref:Uncharacterized protein n=1 Tax=marine sediment metagenome TaxID=412755 RepID=A0A0F9RG65_9ZZZZ
MIQIYDCRSKEIVLEGNITNLEYFGQGNDHYIYINLSIGYKITLSKTDLNTISKFMKEKLP